MTRMSCLGGRRPCLLSDVTCLRTNYGASAVRERERARERERSERDIERERERERSRLRRRWKKRWLCRRSRLTLVLTWKSASKINGGTPKMVALSSHPESKGGGVEGHLWMDTFFVCWDLLVYLFEGG